MPQTLRAEQQIDELLSQLRWLARPPTWSFQLEEIHNLLAELSACWDVYRREGEAEDQG